MAMPQLTLLFLAALATLATLGLFVEFGDRWTSVLVEFVAAILWGIVGISSWDVRIPDGANSVANEPILPMVYLGFGLAIAVGIYAFADLVVGFGEEAAESDVGDALGP